ncbi:MAG: DNA cytosine methyltransferase [Clostridia bacterium]|nr:DNA cytosine methyltransferase [Clostridia bacterium]
MNAQINFFDELIVDNFAGGGGASTGIELATGRVVDIAINHDPSAILMHQTNHPHTEHYQESVWDVDPVKLCRGKPVGLAWFSPDCKHFSKAKGKALVDRKIRGLAWIVLKWAALVRPRVIILENVEEFITWGPVRKGKPVKKKAGQTFDKWLSQLKSLDYDVEYKELVAADYGTPTSRKRFFLIARCDGKPIIWPKQTHASASDIRVKSGELKPYISAAEVIDWSIPCPSIFDSKQQVFEKYGLKAIRPLANNTMRRIARGLDKFVINSQKPFIIPIGYGERKGQAPRVHDINSPLPTEVGTNKHYLCNPLMTPYQMHNHTNAGGTDCREPVNTITSVGAQMLITPIMAQHKFSNSPQDIKNPLSTITSVGAHELITPSLIQYHSEQSDKEVRAYPLDEPLKTVDSSGRYGVMAPYLTKYYSGDSAQRADVPMATVTPIDSENLTACFLSKYFTGVDGADLNSPLPTVTAIDHNSLCMAHIAEFKGKDKGQAADSPLRTITANEAFGVVETFIVKAAPEVNLYRWEKVREMLNTYCDWAIYDDEILLFKINGEFYFIADIGLRMLSPKELYKAMGFPDDYIIDRDYLGNEYKRKYQVARCGNAVCPQVAKALVQANLPEYCTGVNINTMKELLNKTAI